MSMADIHDFCFLLTILASFYGPFKGKNIHCSIIYSIDLIFYLIIEFQEFEFFHFFLIDSATFVGNSYQTFGLATDKTYQTELNLTGPNKK